MTAILTADAKPATLTMPPAVTFDPPVSATDFSVTLPACPCCGDGTVLIKKCANCGTAERGGCGWCCDRPMGIGAAYVSLLPGMHENWCALSN
jgi:hypothetical protein